MKAEDECVNRFFSLLPSEKEWVEIHAVIRQARSSGMSPSVELRKYPAWRKMMTGPALFDVLKELGSWLWPPLPDPESAANRVGEQMHESGLYTFHKITTVTDAIKSKRPGAPVKRRIVAVRALELKKLKPTKSWMQVTRASCNCDRSEHTQNCMQVLRQEVMALEKVLRKFGIHPWE